MFIFYVEKKEKKVYNYHIYKSDFMNEKVSIMMINPKAVLDKYFTVKSANVEFFALVGSKIQRSLLMLVCPEDVEKFENEVELLEGEETRSVVIKIKNIDNEYRLMLVSFKLRNEDFDEDQYITATFIDILNLEEKLLKVNDNYQIMRRHFSGMEMLSFEYDYINDMIKIFFSCTNQEIVVEKQNIDKWMKNAISSHYIDDKQKKEFTDLCYDIKNYKKSFCYELTSSVFTKGEKIEQNIVRGGSFKTPSGKELVIGTIATVIESRVISVENNFSRTNKDPMTGVLNKEAIIKYAKNKIENISDRESMVICVIDLDNFKMVNDTFGHLYGDKIIISFAELISQMVGDRGVVGRFGGDEFLIVLNDIKDELDLRCVLRAIRTNVEMEFKDVGEDISLTCSIGAATYPKDAANYTELFNKADYCLYLSKMRGKNRYVMFDYMVKEHHYINDKLLLKKETKSSDQINYTQNLIDDIMLKGEDYIIDILSEIGERFKLSRIRIFYGDDLKLKYNWGFASDEENIDFACAKYENLIDAFENDNVFVINYLSNIEVKYPKTFVNLSKFGVMSTVLYLLGSKENVKGIISFETMDMTTHWMDDSIFNFALAGHLLNRCIFK